MPNFHNTVHNAWPTRLPWPAIVSALAVAIAWTPVAWAQQAPMIYPSQGQTFEEQAQDEGACRIWAQQQTGFNPYQGAPTYYSSSSSGGQVVGGAARGAALGAVGGAIGGNAGKGAAIGAGVGAASGLMRRNRNRRAEEEAQQQAAAQYNHQLSNYNRAFGTCMQGRGYAVN